MLPPREIARRLIPPRVRDGARRARSRLQARLLAGDHVECPCCGGRFARFVSYAGRHAAACPGCGSLERHRLLWLYLSTRTNLLRAPLRVLHVAPESVFFERLRGAPGLDYVTADLDSALARVRLDVARLPHPDSCFDVVLCGHVLEHVPDDAAAIAELRRVLRPEGWAVLQVPIHSSLERTAEDPAVTDPSERERLFGQRDHVRRYGRDYPARLEACGFRVTRDRFFDTIAPEDRTRLGLKGESIHLCHPV